VSSLRCTAIADSESRLKRYNRLTSFRARPVAGFEPLSAALLAAEALAAADAELELEEADDSRGVGEMQAGEALRREGSS
jgi:hypothetical protein